MEFKRSHQAFEPDIPISVAIIGIYPHMKAIVRPHVNPDVFCEDWLCQQYIGEQGPCAEHSPKLNTEDRQVLVPILRRHSRRC